MLFLFTFTGSSFGDCRSGVRVGGREDGPARGAGAHTRLGALPLPKWAARGRQARHRDHHDHSQGCSSPGRPDRPASGGGSAVARGCPALGRRLCQPLGSAGRGQSLGQPALGTQWRVPSVPAPDIGVPRAPHGRLRPAHLGLLRLPVELCPHLPELRQLHPAPQEEEVIMPN